MMKFSFNALIVSLLLLAGSLSAQLRNTPQPLTDSDRMRAVAGTSILDPARFTMQHGVSFSMQSGGFGGAYGVGVYSNQLQYLLTPNMTINSQVYLVQPTIGGIPGAAGQDISVYFQTALNWQVTRNINLQLGMSNIPAWNRYGLRNSTLTGLSRYGNQSRPVHPSVR